MATMEHGTAAAYSWESRQGLEHCGACKAFHNARTVSRRSTPEGKARAKADSRARERARQELARRYPDEHQALRLRFLAEELSRA